MEPRAADHDSGGGGDAWRWRWVHCVSRRGFRMEELLSQLARQAAASKHSQVRLLADQARVFTESQQGLLRDPPWELRAKCLEAIKAALDSGSAKLVSLSIQGLQRMLRDDRFASPFESDDETLWMTTQLLDVLPPIGALSEHAQVEVMRVLLNATCQSSWVANNAVVVRLLTLCHELFTLAPRQATAATAAQATACQAVRGYAAMLDEDYESAVSDQQDSAVSAAAASDPALVYEDLLPTYRHLCTSLHQLADARPAPSGGGSASLQFYLATLVALLSALPVRVQRCSALLELTWRQLTPALVRLLGTPTVHCVSGQQQQQLTAASSSSGGGTGDGGLGRGTGALHPQPCLPAAHANLIYSISVELVRLLGAVAAVRPVLESLFHRMLLYPPPQQREQALRAVKQILKTPELLLAFCGPVLIEEQSKPAPANDLSLLLIVLDCILECNSVRAPAAVYTNICCCVALLETLEALCEGRRLPAEYVTRINALYGRLEEADYTGPVTYQCPAGTSRLAAAAGFVSESSLASSYLPGARPSALDSDQLPSNTGYESDSSDATEGPELGELSDDLDELTSEAEEADRKEESLRLRRLRGEDVDGPYRRVQYYDSSSEQERHNCRHFVQTLRALLPSLLAIRSCLEVDQAVQEFASKYCDGLYSSQSDLSRAEPHQLMIMNADGVYLACYSALLLNLKMICSGYYSGKTAALTVTEAEFVQEVHGSGVLVYLSTAWLAELYQQVLQCDLLQAAGYQPAQPRPALVNLLSDLDGLGSVEQGSQLLSDYRRLERAAANMDRDPAVEAGVKLSRRLLSASWDAVLAVLSALLSAPARHGLYPALASLPDRGQHHQRLRQAADVALDGLQRAARLSNVAGLQRRCGSVFSFLTAASCGEGGALAEGTRGGRPRLPQLSGPPVRLHTAHVLSMDVILGKGLDLGSHSSAYWPHIFRCVVYLGEVERRFFSKQSGQAVGARVSAAKPARHDNDALQLTFSPCDGADSESDDPYGYLAAPSSPVAPNVDMAGLVRESGADDTSGGLLSDQYAARAICGLTQQADRLFDDAAHKLNLSALLSFLRELCRASQQQLFAPPAAAAPAGFWRRRRRRLPTADASDAADTHRLLLLTRLADVVLKVARSGRPLVHLVKAWSVVSQHLMEAACHKELAVSKKAVCCIHDTVNALLNSHSELEHFHVNEALLKPLETLLCLELCDADVQDQIVGSICEFVEVNTAEIRSGWRPLFGALRSVRVQGARPPPAAPQEPRPAHLRIVLDVFEAFLSTDNVLVFSNAAVDCILCLLKHVRGPTELQDNQEECAGSAWTEEREQVIEVGALGARGLDLCRAALRYIARCHAILASMFGMRSCPLFHAAHRIQLNTAPQTVDPSLADDLADPSADVTADVSYRPLTVDGAVVSLHELDNSSGLLRVWYLLLEGLAGATVTCPRRHQPQTMETLFSLLRSLAHRPGGEFGVYCVNHLLLPMVQGWLRRATRRFRGWHTFATNFKQCCGLTTDLVVFYHNNTPAEAPERQRAAVDLMLRQLLLVLMECVCQPHEVVSRLGCACIRHLLVSCGGALGPAQWEVAVAALHRALALTLRPLRQLMAAFHAESDNFYGDLGQVKVAARRDCTGAESDRLRQLAHQVFLLDDQRPLTLETSEHPEAEDRSYVFLLYSAAAAGPESAGSDEGLVRVPFRDLVVGLLAHQILLQTAGALLLQGTSHVVPSLSNVLVSTAEPGCAGGLPGFLTQMGGRHVPTLLAALADSQRAAVQFDARSGLKFLVQKVCGAERAANLYKQAGATWTLRAVTLLELGLAALADVGDGDAGDERVRQAVSAPPLETPPGPSLSDLARLRCLLSDVTELYCRLVEQNDCPEPLAAAQHTLLFLLADADDFPELAGDPELSPASAAAPPPPAPPPPPPQQTAGPPRPFVFADLAATAPSPLPPSAAGDVTEPETETEAAAEGVGSDADEEEEVASGGRDDSGLADSDDQVYSVVTQRQLTGVVHDYRRRKPARAMPPTAPAPPQQNQQAAAAAAAGRRNPFLTAPRPQTEPLPPEIEQQRRSSLLKDSQAQLAVWTELLVSTLHLLSDQPDATFRRLLAAAQPSLRALTAHAADPGLRGALADFYHRVAAVYGFAAE